MRTEAQILEEVRRRAKLTLSKSESYGSYRANMNILRGLLWALGYECVNKYSVESILEMLSKRHKKALEASNG